MECFKHVSKRALLILLAAVLALGFGPLLQMSQTAAFAASTPAGYVAMSVDADTLGVGYIKEPTLVPYYEGENSAQVTDRFLGSGNYNASGTPASGFNLTGIKTPRAFSADYNNLPAKVRESLDSLSVYDEEEYDGNPGDGANIFGGGSTEAGAFLSEYNYFSFSMLGAYTIGSGWMNTVNNEFASVGASDVILGDGDVMRWQFTLFWGADIGSDMGTSLTTIHAYPNADKDALTYAVARINSAANKSALLGDSAVQSAYNNANAALENLTIAQADVDSANAALNSAMAAYAAKARDAVMSYLLKTVPSPVYGNEWVVFALARSGYAVPQTYFSDYANKVLEVLDANGGLLPGADSKRTEYSRVIIALTACGVDVTNVGGYNLLTPLSDYNKVINQGVSGADFALIALDGHAWDVPAAADSSNQLTRQKLVDFIVGSELSGGGFNWTAGSDPDPDLTAMTLQALAPYKDQAAVSAVIDRAVSALSQLQAKDGGYASWGAKNSESASQVITALSVLGLDPASESGFVKANGNPLVSLLSYQQTNGAFAHEPVGAGSGMASEQAAYALTAYTRMTSGEKGLYDISDVTNLNPVAPLPKKEPAPVTPTPPAPPAPPAPSAKEDVKAVKNVTKLATPLKKIYIKTGKSLKIPVVAYEGKTAIAAGLTWKSSNVKVATVSKTGVVKMAKKAKNGKKATITATAENGRKLTLTVYASTKTMKLKKFTVKAPASLKKGATKQLTIKLSQPKATWQKITFSSSKKSGLSVDKAGNLKALKKGTYKITIKIDKVTVKKTIKVK